MTSSDSSPIVLHVDQEHEGLRTAVILVLLLFFFVFYWLVYSLLRLEALATIRDYGVFISCLIGLVLALGASAVVERWLKRTWHSGRSIHLDEQGIRVQMRHQRGQHFRWDGHITRLNWTFKLRGYRRGGREKRLPGNWVCLACQLQQDDQRLIVYSYMPPKKAEQWLEPDEASHSFQAISLADVSDSSSLSSRLRAPARPEISNEMLTGKDGRYWLAERHRWTEGLELTEPDFGTFMGNLAKGKSES